MRSLSAELLAAQRAASAVPYLLVTVADRIGGVRRLAFQRLYSGSEEDGYHAATMPADGSLLRARAASGRVYYQRVTSPGPSSNFRSWTDLEPAGNAGVSLCSEGSSVLLFLTDSAAKKVKLRESSDSGATLALAVEVANSGTAVTWLAADEGERRRAAAVLCGGDGVRGDGCGGGLSAAKRRVLGLQMGYSAATGAYEQRLRLGGV